MIIKPQIYNLKLVIVALSTLICALGYFSYTNYTSLNEYHKFLLDENASVEAELNELAFNYNALQIDNRDLQSKLEDSKIRIARILDSVKYLKPDVYLVAHYKKQLELLKSENKKILQLVDQLHAENEFLKQESLRVEEQLNETITMSEDLKVENSTLSRINRRYENKIKKAKVLNVKDVFVEGVRRITSSGSIKSTTSAKRAKKLNVCFTIPDNKFTSKGKKVLYVQVVDPKNNVVGDKGEVKMQGDSSLIFSKKLVVNYNNDSLQECIFVEPLDNEPFVKGNYYINIYHNNTLIGKTSLSLK
ncbi:coiled-coil domain-containing protein [Olleya aquimaris]|uniref:Chromosome partitioning protein ParA n=1 Tax=Olleya aquimaris TaxID=639310 RepID=A0A327RR50_9FLAO|nr:hypothetical protein [Olleya aquimaris]RAJ18083.1 hypothetical protein LY08_00356 [Olleya aquimaris]